MSELVADISKYQGNVDFAKVKTRCKMIVIKATGADDGLYTDSLFTHNRDAARKAGLTCWFYHFKGAGDPVAQANYFVKTVGPLKPNERLVLDDENEPTINTSFISKFAARVKKLTGQDIVVYSNLGRFKPVPYQTWVASYGVNDGKPHDKPNVANMIMWQYTSKGNLAGINGDVDLNLYYPPAKPSPNPKEEIMNKGDVNNLYVAVLGGPADPTGLKTFTGKPWAEVLHHLMHSQEYQRRQQALTKAHLNKRG